ncbi:MAG: M18 family aminopeptidase [Clostridia bacterium]|nr:M18 family aminopeptidase [Clostridia bacterium]
MSDRSVKNLLSFLEASPTAFHAVESTAELLEQKGFVRLREGEKWDLEAGKGYFVTRNQSAVIAFRMPKESATSFMIAASHTDSPTFKLKNECEAPAFDRYIRLNVEPYGGTIFSSWMDRPLSLAGRVILEKDGNFLAESIKIDRDLLLIPNVAIHMNREVNVGYKWNAAVDMLPLFAQKNDEKSSLKKLLAEELNCSEDEIKGMDLYLYNRTKGCVWGANEEFFSAPRIDNLMCLYGTLQGLFASESDHAVNVFYAADNEETGSATKQGAGSIFLSDTLSRICESLNLDKRQLLASSMMVSADNGHAKHPNHPEYSDAQNASHLNGGVVIKSNAAQKYTTDGISCALFAEICRRAKVPIQYYANRSDLPGGSTLGSISNTTVPLITVDIGMAQLAMHSSYETAGCEDVDYLVRAMTEFYQSELKTTGDGCYQLLKRGKEVKSHE